MLFAKRFVAGDDISDAVSVARQLEKDGITCSLDHLGEEVKSKKEAESATETYISLIKKVRKNNLNSHISIKLSQIGLAIECKLTEKNLKRILSASRKYNVGVEVDIEGHHYTEETLRLFYKFKNYTQCVQAYLYRTEKDFAKIIKNKGKIRLVKGTYIEDESIAFTDKNEIRKNYIRLMKIYLKKGNFIEIATHDKKIISEAVKFIKENNISKSKYEFEVLYGFKRGLARRLRKKGLNVRVYLPYGSNWKFYVQRRLRELKKH